MCDCKERLLKHIGESEITLESEQCHNQDCFVHEFFENAKNLRNNQKNVNYHNKKNAILLAKQIFTLKQWHITKLKSWDRFFGDQYQKFSQQIRTELNINMKHLHYSHEKKIRYHDAEDFYAYQSKIAIKFYEVGRISDACYVLHQAFLHYLLTIRKIDNESPKYYRQQPKRNVNSRVQKRSTVNVAKHSTIKNHATTTTHEHANNMNHENQNERTYRDDVNNNTTYEDMNKNDAIHEDMNHENENDATYEDANDTIHDKYESDKTEKYENDSHDMQNNNDEGDDVQKNIQKEATVVFTGTDFQIL